MHAVHFICGTFLCPEQIVVRLILRDDIIRDASGNSFQSSNGGVCVGAFPDSVLYLFTLYLRNLWDTRTGFSVISTLAVLKKTQSKDFDFYINIIYRQTRISNSSRRFKTGFKIQTNQIIKERMSNP